MRIFLTCLLLLSACGGEGDSCEPDTKIAAYPDDDGDGFGESGKARARCSLGPGFVAYGGDCDDSDAESYPGARELCDGLDNNCNDAIDETLETFPSYEDADGDGRGNASSVVQSCAVPEGFSDNADDCDDANAARFFGAPELCDDVDNDCDGLTDDEDDVLDAGSATTYFRDNDRDGFGNGASVQLACASLGDVWSLNPDDCDDNNPNINPMGLEVCNTLDDNCDQLVDEDDPTLDLTTQQTSYADADGDGFGDPLVTNESCVLQSGFVINDQDCDDSDPAVRAPSLWNLDVDDDSFGDGVIVASCTSPGADHVLAVLPVDCDDLDPLRYPGATEVCNGGIDDDCDGSADDLDGDLDLATTTHWFLDADGDGFGDTDLFLARCLQPPGSLADGTDCDDDAFDVNPLADEICDTIDNDCDGDVDDDDIDVDPAGYSLWYLDSDGDGVGDPLMVISRCNALSGYVGNRDDCDDQDPLLGSPADWYPDLDGDGWGDPSGLPLGGGPSCVPPVPDSAPDSVGFDCDDGNAEVNPGLVEVCGDGLDNDCVGGDDVCPLPVSCLAHLNADPASVSATYTIEPSAGVLADVYCDMDTDGGGWTLVGSTSGGTLMDQAASYYEDLSTVEPLNANAGVWSGMRDVIAGNSDIRFTCKLDPVEPQMTVDLSFYDIHWYREITTGSDADSCFNEDDGAGYDQPAPARQDNLTLDFRASGEDWSSGLLEGEDHCGAVFDFAVDFDDRGKDSNEDDGTDWGQDDGIRKCGVSGTGEAWFIFVREP